MTAVVRASIVDGRGWVSDRGDADAHHVQAVNPADGVSDRELWQRSAAGDADAFARIFERHGRKVHSYCERRLGDPHAAEDVVSTVFLESWNRRQDVELYQDSALPWLYGVAARQLRRSVHVAQRHRQAMRDAAAEFVADEPDHADRVASMVDASTDAKTLRLAIERLGTIDQDVLLLCIWQELSYAEAAVALSVPVGTVRSRLSRARDRLAAQLASLPQHTGQDDDDA